MGARAVPALALAALLCAACGQGDQTASAPGAGAEEFNADALIAEIEAAPPAEPETAPPATDWIEVPLADGVYSEGAEVEGGERISIPVPAYSALEYKLDMKQGGTIAYSWTAEGLSDPDALLSEFHGHTERVGDAPGTVMFYRRGRGAAESGVMTAPFDGIHGWYLMNDSLDPVTVQLDVVGDYEIVPGQLP